MSRAKRFMEQIKGKTSITQILKDIRQGVKGKFDPDNSKTNFNAQGAVFEFDFEDGIRYQVFVKSLGQAKGKKFGGK